VVGRKETRDRISRGWGLKKVRTEPERKGMKKRGRIIDK
jgi:hypothetical protein